MSGQQKSDRAEVVDELSALTEAARTAGLILSAACAELLYFPRNRLVSLDPLDLIKRIEDSDERHQSELVCL